MSDKMHSKLVSLPPDMPIRLKNLNCLYCGTSFVQDDADRSLTREHVIARNFVPHVSFGKQWNLIANACHKCNNRKSDLEDDIGAITMQPDSFGSPPSDDPLFLSKAQSKARGSKSRKTGKPVSSSTENFAISGEFVSQASFTVNMVAGAQIEPKRAFALARFHIAAFFYFITYQKQQRVGGFWEGVFAPIALVPRGDWGNEQLLGFQDLIETWRWRLHAIGADSYFKAIIKKPRNHDSVWAWALEWNKNHRVFGFFGEEDACSGIYADLPVLQMQTVERRVDPKVGSVVTRFREQVPLPSGRDKLFER